MSQTTPENTQEPISDWHPDSAAMKELAAETAPLVERIAVLDKEFDVDKVLAAAAEKEALEERFRQYQEADEKFIDENGARAFAEKMANTQDAGSVFRITSGYEYSPRSKEEHDTIDKEYRFIKRGYSHPKIAWLQEAA